MKLIVTIVVLVVSTSTFPTKSFDDLYKRDPTAFERAQAILRNKQLEDTFNATEQYIPTNGEHRFIPPGATDLRGPCSALNSLANHGYIDRSGYTRAHEAVAAAVHVFGLGSDLAGFLTTYAAVVHGDLTAFSIGGQPCPAQAAPSGGQKALGSGLSNSHNKMEGDASPITPNKREAESGGRLRIHHLQQLFDMHSHSSHANYDIPTLADFRTLRHADSISEDKNFFHGPFTGILMQSASYIFMYRMLANHSEEYPAGILTRDVIKSFYGFASDEDKMKWTQGHERIPENWFRRSKSSPYDNYFFLNDVLYQASQHPELFRIGGNIGGRASNFRPVDIHELTAGAYRAATLTQNWNFACFAYQSALKTAVNTVSEQYYNNPVIAMNQLYASVDPILNSLACPRWMEAMDVKKHFAWYNAFTKETLF